MSEGLMLSRHGEALFWAGRYLDRAQGTVRLLDVTYHSQIEADPREARRAWRELLEVLFQDEAYRETYDVIAADSVNEFLVLRRDNPASVRSSIRRVRENARSVRELLSPDLWLAINDLHLGIESRDALTELEQHPWQLYNDIRRGCQTVLGVALETMPRTDGWRFFMFGSLLERAEMTCRLLEVYLGRTSAEDPVAAPNLTRVLESASATAAYLRDFSATSDATDVVSFLLLSRTFPRSVASCLQGAEDHLAGLETEMSTPSTPLRLLGRLRAELQFLDPAEVASLDLASFLDRLQADALEISAAIGERFFSGDETELQLQEWRGGPNVGVAELADLPGYR